MTKASTKPFTRQFKFFCINMPPNMRGRLDKTYDYINSDESKEKGNKQLQEEVLEKFGLHIAIRKIYKSNKDGLSKNI